MVTANRRGSLVSMGAGVALSVIVLVIVTQLGLAQSSIWKAETVDTGALFVSLALDHRDAPHVAYSWAEQVKYAYNDGWTWIISALDAGNYPSLALGPDSPHISYYNGEDGDLRYASWTNTGWLMETVDSLGNVGVYTSLTLDAAHHPHISYANRDTGELKYATFDGSRWTIEVIDTGMHNLGEFSSIALDASDTPHVAYNGNWDLKLAWRGSSGWSTETIDSPGSVGMWCSLAFDSRGVPHISYFHYDGWKVRYATRRGVDWEITDVADGSYSSLALGPDGDPHIAYKESEHLRHAWHDEVGWHTEVIGRSGINPYENWSLTIAMDSQGQPAVAYWGTAVSLTYARRGGFECPEPANNSRGGACGPLMPHVTYREYLSSPSDEYDWFYFDMATTHTIDAWLTDIAAGCDYDLYLRRSDGSHVTSSANSGNVDEHIQWGPGPPRCYYLVVVQISGWSSSVPYALRADFGQAAPTATPTSTRLPTSTPTRTPTVGPTVPRQHRTYLPVIVRTG